MAVLCQPDAPEGAPPMRFYRVGIKDLLMAV